MTGIEERNGQLVIYLPEARKGCKPRNVVRISEEAATIVAEVCMETGLSQMSIASEFIKFAAKNYRIERKWRGADDDS